MSSDSDDSVPLNAQLHLRANSNASQARQDSVESRPPARTSGGGVAPNEGINIGQAGQGRSVALTPAKPEGAPSLRIVPLKPDESCLEGIADDGWKRRWSKTEDGEDGSDADDDTHGKELRVFMQPKSRKVLAVVKTEKPIPRPKGMHSKHSSTPGAGPSSAALEPVMEKLPDLLNGLVVDDERRAALAPLKQVQKDAQHAPSKAESSRQMGATADPKTGRSSRPVKRPKRYGDEMEEVWEALPPHKSSRKARPEPPAVAAKPPSRAEEPHASLAPPHTVPPAAEHPTAAVPAALPALKRTDASHISPVPRPMAAPSLTPERLAPAAPAPSLHRALAKTPVQSEAAPPGQAGPAVQPPAARDAAAAAAAAPMSEAKRKHDEMAGPHDRAEAKSARPDSAPFGPRVDPRSAHHDAAGDGASRKKLKLAPAPPAATAALPQPSLTPLAPSAPPHAKEGHGPTFVEPKEALDDLRKEIVGIDKMEDKLETAFKAYGNRVRALKANNDLVKQGMNALKASLDLHNEAADILVELDESKFPKQHNLRTMVQKSRVGVMSKEAQKTVMPMPTETEALAAQIATAGHNADRLVAIVIAKFTRLLNKKASGEAPRPKAAASGVVHTEKDVEERAMYTEKDVEQRVKQAVEQAVAEERTKQEKVRADERKEIYDDMLKTWQDPTAAPHEAQGSTKRDDAAAFLDKVVAKAKADAHEAAYREILAKWHHPVLARASRGHPDRDKAIAWLAHMLAPSWLLVRMAAATEDLLFTTTNEQGEVGPRYNLRMSQLMEALIPEGIPGELGPLRRHLRQDADPARARIDPFDCIEPSVRKVASNIRGQVWSGEISIRELVTSIGLEDISGPSSAARAVNGGAHD